MPYDIVWPDQDESLDKLELSKASLLNRNPSCKLKSHNFAIFVINLAARAVSLTFKMRKSARLSVFCAEPLSVCRQPTSSDITAKDMGTNLPWRSWL